MQAHVCFASRWALAISAGSDEVRDRTAKAALKLLGLALLAERR